MARRPEAVRTSDCAGREGGETFPWELAGNVTVNRLARAWMQ